MSKAKYFPGTDPFLATLLSFSTFFISESFPGSVRYSGSALGYQLASLTAGGPAPIVGVYLYQRFHSSTAIAIYIAIAALISLISVGLLQDKTGTLDHE